MPPAARHRPGLPPRGPAAAVRGGGRRRLRGADRRRAARARWRAAGCRPRLRSGADPCAAQTRTLMGKAALSCCRFLAGNASLLLLGTAAGEVLVYNYAVGQLKVGACTSARGRTSRRRRGARLSGCLVQDRALLRDKAGHEDTGAVQAMAVAGSVLLVASSSGALCSFRCATHEGLLQPIRVRPGPEPARAARPAGADRAASPSGTGLLPAESSAQAGCSGQPGHGRLQRPLRGAGAADLLRHLPAGDVQVAPHRLNPAALRTLATRWGPSGPCSSC